MIVTEPYATRSDGVKLFRTFSDEGFSLIRNDGVPYDEAVDVEGCGYTYTESDQYINGTPEVVPAEEALAELLEVLE